MALSDIVQISILVASTAPQQADFGIPLIVGKTPWPDLVRSYTTPASMLTDGFVATDPVYQAALKMQSQGVIVPLFKVGKRNLLPATSVLVTPTAVNLTLYTIYFSAVGGVLTAASFTSSGAATQTNITTGLVAAINALSIPNLTVVNNGTSFSLTSTAGLKFEFGIGGNMLTSGLLTVQDASTDGGIATDMAAILNYDNNWYGFTSPYINIAEAQAGAVWAEANQRQFFVQTQDTNVCTATVGTLADTLKAAGYKYTALAYSGNSNEYFGAAWMGDRYPAPAGAENWMFAQLAGVTPSQLTPNMRSNLTGHNCNFYVTEAGISLVFLGIAAGGQYIDITRGNDWLVNTIQTGIYTALLNSSTKVPYTDTGIALCEAQLRSALQQGVDRKFLSGSPAPSISVPKASAALAADKAARILRNLNFSAVYAGAIDKVIIQGQLSF